jgi:hypothetical protein
MKRKLHFSPHERMDNRSKAEQRWSVRRREPDLTGSFNCINCGALVIIDPMLAGVLNRNHCPYCLWSRHLDLLEAGDRLSACKAPMRPIGLTLKQSRKKYARPDSGELMLIHACVECAAVSINRIAADDVAEVILALFDCSLDLDQTERFNLANIRALTESDRWLVEERLFGRMDPPGESMDNELLTGN